MNDLISRQAAIDKFEPWLKVKGYSEGELNMLKAILFELTVMPPAQHWIPCSERLPDESNFYMVTNEYDEVEIIWFAHKDDYDIDKSEWRETESTILAWMPLPESYMEVDE